MENTTVSPCTMLIHALGLASGLPGSVSREASSALKLSAPTPSASVSNSDTAPRTTGSPSGLMRRVMLS